MSGFGRGGRGAALLKLLEEPSRKPGAVNGDSATENGQNGKRSPPSGEGAKTGPAPRMFGRGSSLSALMQQSSGGDGSKPPVQTFGRGLGGASSQVALPGRGQILTKKSEATGSTSSSPIETKHSPPSHSSSPHSPSPPPLPSGGQSPSSLDRVSPPALVGEGGDAPRTATRPQARPGLEEGMKDLNIGEKASQRGSSGTPVRAASNYIHIKCRNHAVFQYAVSYSPEIDSKRMRFRLLYEHSDVIGRVRAFDGAVLYLPIELKEQVTLLTSVRPTDNVEVTVKIQMVKALDPKSCIQVYNVIFKRIMRLLDMTQVGRNYFNPHLKVTIPQHKLEVWPGYITTIQEYEGGLMLQCDVSHKVLNYESVLDTMMDIYQRNKADYMSLCVKELVGCVVLTRYNNATYRIDDINWNLNPQCKFQLRRGEEISYQEYYRKSYELEIEDTGQPLLINWPKKPHRPGEEIQPIHLVPELCSRTGLTDNMRQDFKVMKDLAMHTRITPAERHNSLKKFIRNIYQNESALKELLDWGLDLDKDILELEARQLPLEKIIFKNNMITANPEADWGRELTNNSVIVPVALNNWLVIFTRRDNQRATNFVSTMEQVCRKMGIQMNQPTLIALPDDRTQTYLTHLRDRINPNLQMVVAIFPTSRDDRYSAFKRLCCIEAPIPSQAILSKTIGNPQKLRSVTVKIALQLNCKMGGELWALNVPAKNLMVVGIDVYHDAAKGKRSIGAFVSSLNERLTRWYSRVCFQTPQQELIDGLKVCLASALKKYHHVRHCLPDKIVIFRDGVGDGQLAMVATYEKEQLSECFSYFPDYTPELAIVVVQKRINTRLFHVLNSRNGKMELSNPNPGFIVDHTITRPHWYDFFLVSQHVRQGTVSPTHYVVVHDSSRLKPDHMQRLAYKLTHLYYNWPGTVRVPAPCQYAHKLAYLVGQNLHKEPDELLSDKLFFL